MNFWGSGEETSSNTGSKNVQKRTSTLDLLALPATEAGAFYQKLNKDIEILRKKVDKKLRDMMAASEADLSVLNSALGEFKFDESIADQLITKYPPTKSTMPQIDPMGKSMLSPSDGDYDNSHIVAADSTLTERAANLSRRGVPKKSDSYEAKLIGIVKHEPVPEEDEEDEDEEVNRDFDILLEKKHIASQVKLPSDKTLEIAKQPNKSGYTLNDTRQNPQSSSSDKANQGKTGVKHDSHAEPYHTDVVMQAGNPSDQRQNLEHFQRKSDSQTPQPMHQGEMIMMYHQAPISRLPSYEEHSIIVLHDEDDEDDEQQHIMDLLEHDFDEEQERLIEIISVEDYESTGEYIRQQIPMSAIIEELDEADEESSEASSHEATYRKRKPAHHESSKSDPGKGFYPENSNRLPNHRSQQRQGTDENSDHNAQHVIETTLIDNQGGPILETIIEDEDAVIAKIESYKSTDGEVKRPDPSPRETANPLTRLKADQSQKESLVDDEAEEGKRPRKEPYGKHLNENGRVRDGDKNAQGKNKSQSNEEKGKETSGTTKPKVLSRESSMRAPTPEVEGLFRKGRSIKERKKEPDSCTKGEGSDKEKSEKKKSSTQIDSDHGEDKGKPNKSSLVSDLGKSIKGLKEKLDLYLAKSDDEDDYRRPSPERPRRSRPKSISSGDHNDPKTKQVRGNSKMGQSSTEESEPDTRHLTSGLKQRRQIIAKKYKLPIHVDEDLSGDSQDTGLSGSDPASDSDNERSSLVKEQSSRKDPDAAPFEHQSRTTGPIDPPSNTLADEESSAPLVPWKGSHKECTRAERLRGIRAAEHVLASFNNIKLSKNTTSDLDRKLSKSSSDSDRKELLINTNVDVGHGLPTSENKRTKRRSPREAKLVRSLRRGLPSQRMAPPVDELVFNTDGDSESTEDLDMDGASQHVERPRRKTQPRSPTSKKKSKASKADTTATGDQQKQFERKKKIGSRSSDTLRKGRRRSNPVEKVGSIATSNEGAPLDSLYDDIEGKEDPKQQLLGSYIGDHHQESELMQVLTYHRSYSQNPTDQQKHGVADLRSSREKKSHNGRHKTTSPQTTIVTALPIRNESLNNLSPLSREDFNVKRSASRSSNGKNSTGVIGDNQLILLQQVQNKLISDPYGDAGRYTGVMVGGKPHGQGTMHYNDGRVYSGEWRNGRWNGYGHAVFTNGDAYIGQYENDQRHGHGRYEWADGRVYDGGFQHDHRQGEGTYTWPDGAVYTGDFYKGLRHGQGRYIFPDGSVYNGEWENGKYHGMGECIWVDGRRYKGEWRNGQAQGYGVEHRPDGSIRHEGQWRNDRPVRTTTSRR